MRPMQKPMPREMELPSGISNQAMLSMLESQGMQTAPRPASGGTPLDEAMRVKFERQFGLPMGDVRVHHNSDEPDKFGAGAYTYGTDVFIRPGQEKLLNHEMTHVAQQKLGQVRPTGVEHGIAVNRSPVLEHSADMGTVPQMAEGATGPVVQCGDDGDIEQAPSASKGRKRSAPSSTDEGPEAKRARKFFNAAELREAPSGLTNDKERMERAVKDAQFSQITPTHLAFCFRTSSEKKAKESSSKADDQSVALFDSGIVERFIEKRKDYERPKDGDKSLDVVQLLSKRIVRAQGRELSRYLTKTQKRRPTSAFGDKTISRGTTFAMPLLFEGDPSEQIVVSAGFMGKIKKLGRLIHQGQQPYLTTSPQMGTKYDDIIKILNGLDREKKKYVFDNILRYLTADTEPAKCTGELTDEQRRAANTLAALLVVESHYSRALADGGKFARAAVRFCNKNPDQLAKVFGSDGAFTMSRFAGGETTDALLDEQDLELFEKKGKTKKRLAGDSDKVTLVYDTLQSIAKEMSDSSDEEDAPPRRKPRRHKKRKTRCPSERPDSSDEEDAPPSRKPRRHKKRPDRGHGKSAR